MALTDTQLEIALRQFGVERSEFAFSGPEELERLKTKVRKNFREVARRLHPDVTNNDPLKTALFRIAKEFAREVSALSIQPKPKRSVVRFNIRWSA